MRRPSLALQFLVANLVVLLAAMLILGAWVGQQIETAVLDHAGSTAAAYVDGVISPRLQVLRDQPGLSQAQTLELDQLLPDALAAQNVVSFKVWSVEGTVLYSPNRDLIGRQYPVDAGLAEALAGDVSSEISDLDEPENEFERQSWTRLLSVYAPIRSESDGRVVAVTEFYQPPDQLDADLTAARLRSWLLMAAVMGGTYLLLAGIVKRGSDTIIHQDQLVRRQFNELSALHERVSQAAARTTTLNEQALRRIGADLHDGPGQMLALALLRLSAVRGRSIVDEDTVDLTSAEDAVRDALKEIRTISADLRIPDLEPLTLCAIAERAVHDHQRRTGARVDLVLGALPDAASLAIKTALLRTLQEALSNATRHGGDGCIEVELLAVREELELRVSDHGPGLDVAEAVNRGRLGLVGMRERAEVLGGHFDIRSRKGEGTTVVARWPLSHQLEEVF